jgi:hypothetical protein
MLVHGLYEQQPEHWLIYDELLYSEIQPEDLLILNVLEKALHSITLTIFQ